MRPVAAVIAATFVATGCAPADRPSSNPIFIAADAGNLQPGVLARLAQAVPAPPVGGSAQDLADKAASARFKALEDSDRWLLATAHAELRPPLALQHFDCALGVRLGSADTPVLDRMMVKAFHDAEAVAERVKARVFRARPVGDDPERRSCQSLTPAARRAIGLTATQLQGCEIKTVQVLGLASSTGGADANQALSEQRALAVAEALTAAGWPTPAFELTAAGDQGATTPSGVAEPLRRRTEVLVEAAPR